jgi:hypothetical protein
MDIAENRLDTSTTFIPIVQKGTQNYAIRLTLVIGAKEFLKELLGNTARIRSTFSTSAIG